MTPAEERLLAIHTVLVKYNQGASMIDIENEILEGALRPQEVQDACYAVFKRGELEHIFAVVWSKMLRMR